MLEAILPAAAAVGSAIAQGGPRRQYKWNKRAAEDANAMNRANQEWMIQQNIELRDEQRAYDLAMNSPAAMMRRFKEAGLNPMLIYGQGTTADLGPSVQSSGLAPTRLEAPDASLPDVSGSFLAAADLASRIKLTEARTSESYVNQALKEVQVDIAKSNPMLNPAVATGVANEVLKTAELKAAQSSYIRHGWVDYTDSEGRTTSQRVYVAKIQTEIEAMAQRLGLNNADQAIRNKILESKEFENAIKEVQAKWLKDAEISPEHIRQGLMLLLTSWFR